LLWVKSKLNNLDRKLKNVKKVERFWDLDFVLPEIEKDFIVSLKEGGTPCLHSQKIGESIGIDNLIFKDETKNPTNSFKDRVATLLISHARSWGFDKVICVSNGNQGASIAAYTSIEGMNCINIFPNSIDIGKKAQMIAYNSETIEKGNTIDDILILSLDDKYKDYYQCTPEFNPLTIEAQKTISYEIFLQIGQIDWIVIPMGSGELLVSIWKGFKELREAGIIDEIPKLIGVQSQSLAPIALEYLQETSYAELDPIVKESLASGILVKDPIYKDLAIKSIKESNGTVVIVPENNILIALEDLIEKEGIFAEPTSALTLAAIYILSEKDTFDEKEKITCLITGSGLKAPYVLEALSSRTKTMKMGGILSTKLKILSQISLSGSKGTYGKKIRDAIDSVSLPAIYQHLKDLEAKELIIRKKKGKNVLYFLTEKGKKVLDALDILITLL